MSAHQRLHLFTALSRAALGSGVLVAALAVTPTALAAAPRSGGASLTPSAATVDGTTAPFTIGLSASSVPAGSRLTISGLANARAGTRLTLVSNAFSSSRRVGGAPAITTSALAEGTYRTTVLVPAATKPGAYAILLRARGRQVASTSARITARGGSSRGGSTSAGSPSGRLTSGGRTGAACAGIAFTVLHRDRPGRVTLPAGAYRITSPNLDCATASSDFTAFLERDNLAIPGWTATSTGPGHATYTQRATGKTLTVSQRAQ